MTDTVLIVDDDIVVLKTLYKVIKSNDLEADTAMSGEEAIEKIKHNSYALVLLDVNLTGIDGFETVMRLRALGHKLPIIIVSGRKDDGDTLYGLDLGADDYITKPFNPVTLGAKVKALIRRSKLSGSEQDNIISVGPFTYNTSTLRFFKNSVEISLTNRENALLKLFLDNVNRIFSKDMLYDMVWGDALIDDATIMVYINRLRQKIEDVPECPKYIQNVRGIGYRFVI